MIKGQDYTDTLPDQLLAVISRTVNPMRHLTLKQVNPRASVGLAVLSILVLSLGGVAQPSRRSTSHEKLTTPRQIAQKVLRSVVLVKAKDRDGNVIAQGSGFFFGRIGGKYDLLEDIDATFSKDPKRLDAARRRRISVVTNLHVIKRASKVSVQELNSSKELEVISVSGIDIKHDLCVLELSRSVSGFPLAIVPSRDLAVGDEIYAAGNPEGLQGSFSKGIVSAIRREQGLIQIDAAISPGSSGGPVVNNKGEVVGIAVGTLAEGQNLNFAVPSDYLSKLRLVWSLSVQKAGAIAITAREKERLKGPVERVIVSDSKYRWDERTKSPILSEPKTQEMRRYDFNGDVKEFIQYWDRGVALHQIYSYGELGCINSTVSIDKDGNRSVDNKSDEECVDGRARANSFSGEYSWTSPQNSKITWKYDDLGNELEKRVENADGSTELTKSSLDSRGLLREQFYKQSGGYQELRRYTYEFDRFGNWVRRMEVISFPTITSDTGSPSKLTIREITYFDR